MKMSEHDRLGSKTSRGQTLRIGPLAQLVRASYVLITRRSWVRPPCGPQHFGSYILKDCYRQEVVVSSHCRLAR